MVEDFHRRGVKVLFPMMMWDQGPEMKASRMGSNCRIDESCDADGVNGDTQDGVPVAFAGPPKESAIRWRSNRKIFPRAMRCSPGTS